MLNIAILASGSGSNAQAIMDYFKDNSQISVHLVISNNMNAGVLQRAEKNNIKTVVINSNQTKKGLLFKTLKNEEIDFIVLAGYMKLIPSDIIKEYANKIVNIHPALLPKFGGKGMYGMNVHQAVVNAGEKVSGITIHYVDENYDEGSIIFQDSVALSPDESAEAVQKKVLVLEHQHYPKTIEKVLQRHFL